MFHPGTTRLIDLWSALPDARRIPPRAALEPLTFGVLTPQLFSTELTTTAARIRVAGGLVERLHGRPLRGGDWLKLWRRDDRAALSAALVQTVREARPTVLTLSATRLTGALEIAAAPLRGPSGRPDRLLGLYQPLHPADRDPQDVGPLTLLAVTPAGALDRTPLALATLHGRRIA